MTEIPTTSSAPASPASVSTTGAGDGRPDTGSVDLVLAGRAVSSGQFLAGLIAAAELDTVGTPRKLARDLFPDVDPAVVQEIWDRALVVGVRAGRLMGAPRFHRDKLARLQAELVEAGHHAMGGMVGGPLAVAQRFPELHPADGEDAREH